MTGRPRVRSDRRGFLRQSLAAGLVACAAPGAMAQPAPLMRRIPSSGEAVPAVGLGSWITFNVGDDAALLESSAAVMDAFFDAGGTLIDSSPMYGSAQATIGYGLRKLNRAANVFSADKVWIRDAGAGPAQIAQSRDDWTVPRFDLLQVHNLVAWRDHLETLAAMKAAGELRYVGVTTSHQRRHRALEAILAGQRLDFVQLTYNPVDRAAERRLLPLARERGIGVIVNRPFQRGALVDRLAGQPLPPWAAEIGASSWAQLIVKFIISHPAVTCVIPATTRVDHVRENLDAAQTPLPDAAMRERISAVIRDS